jgi:uncharacterized membrane protein YeiH
MILVGELSLWIALLMAAWTTTVSFAGGMQGRPDLIKSGERAMYATFGFVLLATVTGIGGGSVRDVLLGEPAFWTSDPRDVLVCIAVGVLSFLAGTRIPGLMAGLKPRSLLLWADALGLAIFSVNGAARALEAGTRKTAS